MMEFFSRIGWMSVTNFGDLAVLIPVAAIIMAWLTLTGRWRGALAYAISVTACLGATVLIKLLFLTHVVDLPGVDNPSGHTSSSIAVYGDLAALVALALPWRERLVVIVGCIAWVAAIIYSRIELHFHSIGEAAIGTMVGLAAVWLFTRLYRAEPQRRGEIGLMLAVIVTVMIVLHSKQFPSVEILEHLTRDLS